MTKSNLHVFTWNSWLAACGTFCSRFSIAVRAWVMQFKRTVIMNNMSCFHGVYLGQILFVWSSIGLFKVYAVRGETCRVLSSDWSIEPGSRTAREESLIMKRPSYIYPYNAIASKYVLRNHIFLVQWKDILTYNLGIFFLLIHINLCKHICDDHFRITTESHVLDFALKPSNPLGLCCMPDTAGIIKNAFSLCSSQAASTMAEWWWRCKTASTRTLSNGD